MSTLHTINKSPFTYSTLMSCIQVCGDGDGILLLEDGVLCGLKAAPCAEELSSIIARGVKVFALRQDVQARGLIETVRSDINLTNYDGFVRLSIEHRCVQSWY